MNTNSNSSRDLSAHPSGRRPAPRWRSLFLALIFVLGGAGQTLPARAAPADPTTLVFYMVAVKEGLVNAPLCKGQLLLIDALVYRYQLINGASQDQDTVKGASVNALVENPSVGHVSPETNTTILASSPYPGAADFVFTAENYGSTTIKFLGIIATPGWFGTNWGGGAETVYAQVNVKVIPCKFKVTIDSKWNAGMTSVATMNGEIKSDNMGNFTGTATVNWVTSILCGIKSPVAPSTANLTGQIDDSGQLALKIIFGPASSAGGGVCKVSTTTANSMTINALFIKVAASSNTVSKLAQVIKAKNGSFSGTATITVIPLPQ